MALADEVSSRSTVERACRRCAAAMKDGGWRFVQLLAVNTDDGHRPACTRS